MIKRSIDKLAVAYSSVNSSRYSRAEELVHYRTSSSSSSVVVVVAALVVA